MQIDWQLVIQLINSVGVPVILILWGPWFVTTKIWPWWTGDRQHQAHEVAMATALGLQAIGEGLKALAEKLPDPDDSIKLT